MAMVRVDGNGHYLWTQIQVTCLIGLRVCDAPWCICWFQCCICIVLLLALPQYLMNGLNNFDKTNYSLASTDDLIRFWTSQIKGHGHSRPWWRHPPRRCGMEVQLLCVNFVMDAYLLLLSHFLFIYFFIAGRRPACFWISALRLMLMCMHSIELCYFQWPWVTFNCRFPYFVSRFISL